jgi:D-tagatose-1,6-bisphosphate aldolase subunit GatZ/KbaZ
MNATERILAIVESNLAGDRVGVYSVCSAERRVLEAALTQALRDDSVACIESTCNQVNQFGGYSGRTPADFRDLVSSVAHDVGLSMERVLLGGDHLGPWPWRGEAATSAMTKAADLVGSCVSAGYTKIHLDASMRCVDDPGTGYLDEAVATERTVSLCAAAESAHTSLSATSPAPIYVIGTEVPIPGGEQEGDMPPAVSRPEDVQRVVERTRAAFLEAGLGAAWERVIAVVTQPGVEFGDSTVFAYDRQLAAGLSAHLEQAGHRMVFEAHSTDYQTDAALGEMVEDHFAILKVGPALTFAMREALFALAAIERELLDRSEQTRLSNLPEILDAAMVANPEHWRDHYRGDERELRLARAYSYSDRCRYYWPVPQVREALDRLVANLSAVALPPTLISQYMPSAYEAVRAGEISGHPEDLIRHRIMEVTGAYARACGDTQGP